MKIMLYVALGDGGKAYDFFMYNRMPKYMLEKKLD